VLSPHSTSFELTSTLWRALARIAQRLGIPGSVRAEQIRSGGSRLGLNENGLRADVVPTLEVEYALSMPWEHLGGSTS